MRAVVEMMISSFSDIKASGSFLLLYLLSILYLYCKNREKHWPYLYYGVGGFLLLYGNPLTIILLGKVFRALENYNYFVLLVPVLVFVPFVIVELFEEIKDSKLKKIYLLLAVLVIGLAGNLYGFSREAKTFEDSKRITAEQKDIITLLNTQNTENVLADETIVPFLRSMGDNITLLYGKDLWTHGMDLGIMDSYSEELMSLYEAMENPKDTFRDITDMAELYQCDFLIVKKFKYYPSGQGGYELFATSDNYLIYQLKDNE